MKQPLQSALSKTAVAAALSIVAVLPGALSGGSAAAQEAAPPEANEHPEAAPADVESFDAIIKALYDVISGEKVEADGTNARDWDRFVSLFHPELGRLIPLRADARDPEAPRWQAVGMRPGDYVEQARSWMLGTAFYENEVHRVEETFGGIAHAWSTYEGFNAKDADEPFLRGVNSIQAMFDGQRWWILVVAWDAERPDQRLPAKYLPDDAAK